MLSVAMIPFPFPFSSTDFFCLRKEVDTSTVSAPTETAEKDKDTNAVLRTARDARMERANIMANRWSLKEKGEEKRKGIVFGSKSKSQTVIVVGC